MSCESHTPFRSRLLAQSSLPRSIIFKGSLPHNRHACWQRRQPRFMEKPTGWLSLIIVLLIPLGTRHIVLVHPWPNCDGKPAICSECSSALFWLLYLVCSIVERTLGTYFKLRFHRSQSFYLFWWNPRGQSHPCSDGKPLDPVFLSCYRSYRSQQIPCCYTGTDPTEPSQSCSFMI